MDREFEVENSEVLFSEKIWNFAKRINVIHILTAIFMVKMVGVGIYRTEQPDIQPGKLSAYSFATGIPDDQGQVIQSLVYLPVSYDADDNSKRWPLVLFLHGSWQRGNNVDLARNTGVPKLINDGNDYPFVMVAPQCPAEDAWRATDLHRLLDEVESRFNVDKYQIHVTGFELGGYAAWDLAVSTPERFATVVPFSGDLSGRRTVTRPRHDCRPLCLPGIRWRSYLLPEKCGTTLRVVLLSFH